MDTEMQHLSEILKKKLHENILKITFEKKDGTVRNMLCTLKSEHIPQQDSSNKGTKKKENPDVLAVFDVEKNAWRSFRIDSVIQWLEPVNNE